MKYNLSKIMKRAWELKRKNGSGRFSSVYTIGKCLKMAWTEAKQARAKAEREAATESQKGGNFHQGMEITVGYTTYTLNRWQIYGKDRIYINVNTHQNIGYLDVKSGNIYGAPRKLSADGAKAHEIVKSLKIA